MNGVNMTTAFPNFIYANSWADNGNPAIVDVVVGAADIDDAVAGDGDDDDDDDSDMDNEQDDEEEDGSDDENEGKDGEEEEDTSHGPHEDYMMEFGDEDAENDENAH